MDAKFLLIIVFVNSLQLGLVNSYPHLTQFSLFWSLALFPELFENSFKSIGKTSKAKGNSWLAICEQAICSGFLALKGY